MTKKIDRLIKSTGPDRRVLHCTKFPSLKIYFIYFASPDKPFIILQFHKSEPASFNWKTPLTAIYPQEFSIWTLGCISLLTEKLLLLNYFPSLFDFECPIKSTTRTRFLISGVPDNTSRNGKSVTVEEGSEYESENLQFPLVSDSV